MVKDLTVGKPARVLPLFCLPLLGSILFQQLYNIADSLVAGKFIGENALAAVGNSYEITLVFLAVAMGFNIGASVVIARLFGAKEYGSVRTVVRTSLLGAGAICALLMLAGILFARPLLAALETPADVLADSALYLTIYIFGLPFVFLYNVATGIFSALGDSRTPFWFLACSSCANIAIDVLFVVAFRMGVAGVAWATFLCQGVSSVLAVTFLLRRLRALPDDGNARVFSFDRLAEILRIAVPSTVQQLSISVGNVFIQRVINGFGTGVMAGYAAAVKLNNLVITCFTAFATAGSSFTAQNCGADRFDRVRAGYFTSLWMAPCFAVPVTALYLLAANPLVNFFISEPSAAATGSGVDFLRIVAPFYSLIALKIVADGVLRGTGRMTLFMVSTTTDLILRVVLSFLLAPRFGYRGVWASWPIGWLVAIVLSTAFCLSCREMRQGREETAKR